MAWWEVLSSPGTGGFVVLVAGGWRQDRGGVQGPVLSVGTAVAAGAGCRDRISLLSRPMHADLCPALLLARCVPPAPPSGAGRLTGATRAPAALLRAGRLVRQDGQTAGEGRLWAWTCT